MEKNRIRPVKAGKGMRMSYSRQKEVLEMPNLIEVQKDSYQWFLKEGLKEVFFTFLLFIFPMWFFGARGRIMKKIPMLRELKPIPRFIAAAVLYFFLLLIFSTTY